MELTDSRQESARDRWVQQQMEEAMKHLPTDLEVVPSPLLLEEMELAPAGPGSGRVAVDLFTFLSQEAEKTLRRSAGLSVPQSAYDGSRLAIPCPGTGPLRRRSLPAPLAAHSGPAVKPSPSSRRKERQRGAPSCLAGEEVVCLPADVSAAATRCSEATPDELEERLRFVARQIKTFRKTSLIYSSPELMERIMQMEEDYGTAIRQFYCRPLPSTPGLQGAAAAAEQSTPGLQGAAAAAEQSTPGLQGAAAAAEQSTPGLQSAAAEQSMSGLQPAVELSEGGLPPLPGPEHLLSFLWGVLMELKPDTPQPDTPQPVSARSDTPQPDTSQPVSARSESPQPDTPQPVSTRSDSPQPDSPQPDLKSASTSSTCRRGRRKRNASVHATEGLGDASAPAHATEGLCDASAPAHATEGPGDASAPAHATEGPGHASTSLPQPPPHVGLCDASAPAHATEGLCDASAPAHASEGSPGSASASEGSPGSASASEGSPGSASASEGSPGSASASGVRSLFQPLGGSPGSASASGVSPGSAPASEVRQALLQPLRVRQALLQPLKVHQVLLLPLRVRQEFAVARLNSVPARDDLLVARLNSVPARDDLLVARLNSVPARDDLLVARLKLCAAGDDPWWPA
ncbi:hypothetical protein CRENBAI_004235 [Crenichthys baileyi]|uniref:Uncharacterized protein n=1 Tax=Crenichthys baileyi TaxID=28760 RepID=A0AAV9S8X5_9TELE